MQDRDGSLVDETTVDWRSNHELRTEQSEGHALFNKKGTKLPTDEISFIGNRTSESIAPRLMLVKRALTKVKAKPKPAV